MTGLKKEITKNLKKPKMFRDANLTYVSLSKILGVSYPTARRIIECNTLTVDQALTIFSLIWKKNTFEEFEYYFTDRGIE